MLRPSQKKTHHEDNEYWLAMRVEEIEKEKQEARKSVKREELKADTGELGECSLDTKKEEIGNGLVGS